MPLSEAKKAADKRYTNKLDNIMIRPYREEGATIRAAAAGAGMSVQAYVLRAVRAWMEREQEGSVTPERAEARGVPVPEGGLGISAGGPEESLSRTLEDGDPSSFRNADGTVNDWTARLNRSPNRSRTIKVIKRITETPKDGGKSDQ